VYVTFRDCRAVKELEKVQLRATKLVMTIKHLSYMERRIRLNVPTLKYRVTDTYTRRHDRSLQSIYLLKLYSLTQPENCIIVPTLRYNFQVVLKNIILVFKLPT